MFEQQTTINCNGQLLDLKDPIIMGILNITPDSFYDGGFYKTTQSALVQSEKMLNEGVKIIDIGGMSSRPGAEIINLEEEAKRVIPIIKELKSEFSDIILSIDTVYAEIAKRAVEAGASIINDISAGQIDEKMYETVADLGVPYVLMHMKGNPNTMQNEPQYKDVAEDVLDFFIAEVGKLRSLGVKDILLDVGFGFGKTIDHNYTLLKRMHIFNLLKLPILAGISRKSMIYKYLEITPEQALNGTSILNFVALQQGAKILRVHDVKEAKECIRLFRKI